MGKLEFYSTIEDKINIFPGSIIITNKNDFDTVWKNQKDEREFIYRGVNNATFKLYNSAQRFWINNEMERWGIDYHKMIEEILGRTKKQNNSLVLRYFQSLGIKDENNDMPILSFMQHHTGISPLLDFTRNFSVALYFAIQSSDTINFEKNEFENYISVYIIYKSISDLLDAPRQVFKEEVYKRKNNEKYKRPFNYEMIKTIPVATIEDDAIKDWCSYYVGTNFSIMNQSGLFISNNSPVKPLEQQIKDTFVGELDANTKEWISCIEIHKNLIPYIKDIIENEKGITKDSIFPNPNVIVKNAFDNYLKEK